MITTAPRPLPTAASMRGKASKTSLPTGISVPATFFIGALSSTPTARPEKKTRIHCARRPAAAPRRR